MCLMMKCASLNWTLPFVPSCCFLYLWVLCIKIHSCVTRFTAAWKQLFSKLVRSLDCRSWRVFLSSLALAFDVYWCEFIFCVEGELGNEIVWVFSFHLLTSCVLKPLPFPHALSFWLSQLIGGLADEKVRWAESVAHFDSMLVNVVGDVMVSAGAVAYLGPFTVSQICCIHAQLVVWSLWVVWPWNYARWSLHKHALPSPLCAMKCSVHT